MKAIVQTRYGGPENLALTDMPGPQAGDEEVLIRVHAAGVDRGVWHLMTGLPYLVRIMGFGLRAPKSPVPGFDVAGTVEAVGTGVTRFRPGDHVFGTCTGAFAELACAKADHLAPKPSEISFERAAAVPTSAVTALQALRDAGAVQPGQKVLIIGASGGVGSFAVQLAKSFETEVTGVCSTAKMDLVRSLGADHVVDYTRQDPTDGSHRYDLILDTAGNRPLARLRRALTPTGTLVIIGGEGGGRWLGGVDRQLRAFILSAFVHQTLRGMFSMPSQADLQLVAEHIEAGKLTPVVDRSFSLDEVPDAVRYLANGRARGKVVVSVR